MKEILSPDFNSAACDYFWLQEKKYPQRLVFKIVCDRYKLNTIQRVILYRGVFPSIETEKRKKKRLKELGQFNLSIDTTNVVFRLVNYLCGRPVFLCNDDILRDAGDAFDKSFPVEITERAVHLMISFIKKGPLLSARFLIDKPVDGSTRIMEMLLQYQDDFAYPIEIYETYPADRQMNGPTPHAIATADSEIIDSLPYPFIDLPRLILQENFNPVFLEMSDVLGKKE